MRTEFLHPVDQLVIIMERIYKYGMTTTSGGNLSILDGSGDIWITPSGIDKGSLSRKDIIQVKPDGTVIGNHKPSIELPFHKLIYEKRKDVKAVIHAHPPALVAFSVVRRKPDTRLLPDVYLTCGEIDIAGYGLPGSMELGYKVAASFEKGNNAVLLENHGVATVGEDIFKAFMTFETLDFNARLEIEANKIGKPVSLELENIKSMAQEQIIPDIPTVPRGMSSVEKELRREMCQLMLRAYNQKLFISTQGTFSARLSPNSFIITFDNTDRHYIDEGHIAYVDKDVIEAGKLPSRYVRQHKAIYDRHQDINAIITAQPPGIMAFAVTKERFDSRTIPESYILLRNVKKLPFGISFTQPQKIASEIMKESPVLILENECVVAVGQTLIQAFDRLEVAEYSARAVIDSKCIGNIVTIDDEEIIEIDKAFKL